MTRARSQKIDCLIVGAGPAGLAAGIYLRRFYRSVLIVDAGNSRAAQIPRSNNYPGFPDGINGAELLKRMRRQLKRFGGSVISGTVHQLCKLAENEFVAEAGKEVITARCVLLATGVVDIEPQIEGFLQVKTAGLIRFCPICDGFEFTDKRIGVIGAGQHGVREVRFIRNYSKDLTLIGLSPNDHLDRPLCTWLRYKQVKLILGAGRRLFINEGDAAQSVHLEMTDGSVHTFDLLYCALGSHVQSQLAVDMGACCDPDNGLKVDEHLETSITGLYAAGDVVSSLDQLTVAVGQAAIASTAIHNHLPPHEPSGKPASRT